MINGAHVVVYSRDPAADRAFLRDVFGLPYVDVGQGWLIFGLPPAEVAFHPAAENDRHELYLLCEGIEDVVAELDQRRIPHEPVSDEGWGLITHITLPGGGRLGLYEARHARPEKPL